MLDAHATWLTARAPEVDFNSAVLYRELVTHFGYAGSAQQVLRFVRPLRVAARQTRATARFETEPGQQAQVDFGQCRVWVGDAEVTAHVFVCTLGYSRRMYAEAFPHERVSAVLEGHEHAFQHFAGVPAERFLMSGHAKSDGDLAAAVAAGIGGVNVEGSRELDRLEALAARRGRRVPVQLRLDPGPGFGGERRRILDGGGSKFGFALADARRALRHRRRWRHLDVRGIR